MSRSQWWALGLMVAGVVLLASWFSSSAWSQGEMEYPRPCQNVVVPNTKEFGHFPTRWRSWPGEQRLDVINPRAVLMDVLPTPEAEKIAPPPTVEGPKNPAGTPEQGGFLSPEGLKITTPEGTQYQKTTPEGKPEESPSEGAKKPANAEKLPEDAKPANTEKLPDLTEPRESDKALGPLPFESEKTPEKSTVPEGKPGSATAPKTDSPTPPDAALNPKSPPAGEAKGNAASPFRDEAKSQGTSSPKEEPRTNELPTLDPEPLPKAISKPKDEPKLDAPPPPAGDPIPKASYQIPAPPNTEEAVAARTAWPEKVTPPDGDYEPDRIAGLPAYHTDPVDAEAPRLSAEKIKSASFESVFDEIPSYQPVRKAVMDVKGISEETIAMKKAAKKALPTEALNGYCPVELGSKGRWVKGDLRWTVVYQGAIFRLSGPEQRKLFQANPNRYVPVDGGSDLVLKVDAHRQVAGLPSFCATYNGHLYMFANAENQAQFNKFPQRYAAEQ